MTFTLTVLAATALLLSGCNPILPSGGKSVKFKATSKSQPTTKTAYAGNAAATGSSHEDIYWSDGDAIRIFSGNTNVVSPASAVYSLVVPNNNSTSASLQNPQETPNGLTWVQPGDVVFYAVYPPATEGSPTEGSESGYITMNIPDDQSYESLTSYMDPKETKMDHAYMLARRQISEAEFNSAVSLEFYPAFTAFQINLKSKDDELTLNKFKIYSTDNHLAGDYYSKLKNVTEDGPVMDFVNNSEGTLSKEVFLDWGSLSDKPTISSSSEVNFTLLTLPCGFVLNGSTYSYDQYLTNLWLEVSFWKNDEDGNPTGDLIIKKLALKQNDEFYQFDACKKYCINGLAVDGGSKWKLDVNGQVLPWQGYEAKIDDQVSIMPESFKIFGAIESTSQWQNYEIIEGTDPVQYKNAAGNNKANHYYDSNWVPFGREGYGQGENNYDKKYQLRYLNRDGQGYFTVQFTPTAPTGGYWQLIPTFKDGDTMSPNHFRFEVVHPGGAVSDQLKGQILYQPVTIRIYPKDYAFSDQNIYDMWFTCYFSPSSNFTPSISADSEFQDVHGDGRFSYWVFRLAPYEGHFVDE